MTFEEAINDVPIIAIIRGVKPGEAIEIGDALIRAGIRVIETPLNSPDPFASITALVKEFGNHALIGGGTVLRTEDVDHLAQIGGRIAISPNTQADVIMRAVALGLTPMPGFFTPSEAFAALSAGATHLKLFPAATGGFAHARAIRAVLPHDARLYAVGSVRPQEFAEWREAGAVAFGLGSELYKPGMTAEDVHARAVQAVQACRRA